MDDEHIDGDWQDFIRGWAFALRDLCDQGALSVTATFEGTSGPLTFTYTAKRKRGESLDPWNRAQLWPGIHINLTGHPRDRLLGRKQCTTTKGDPEPVVVPMPEGNYPGQMCREERVWKRKRWPWISNRRVDYWIDMEIGIPTPGKGENSWDCEDDAIFGTGGTSPADAIGNVTKAALRQRERYASPGWTPDAGWPEAVASRDSETP